MGVTHLLADALNLLINDVAGRPVGSQAGAVVKEVLQGALTELAVQHFRVPLHTEQAAAAVFKSGHGGLGSGGGNHEAFRGGLHRVAMAHPHHLVCGGGGKQAGVGVHLSGGVSILAGAGAAHAPTQALRHGLEAVADTQDRNASIENGRIYARGAFLVNRGRAAGKNNRRRLFSQHVGDAHGVRDNLGVDLGLTYTSGN